MAFKHSILASLAFMARLFLIPLAVLYMVKYNDWLRNGRPGTGLVVPLVFQYCHLCWSLISASIPGLRRFVRVFSKEPHRLRVNQYHEGGSEPKMVNESPPPSQSEAQTFPWVSRDERPRTPVLTERSIKMRKPKVGPQMNDPSPDSMKLRPEQVEATSTIYHSETSSHGGSRPDTRTGSQSGEAGIRKNMQWDISEHHAR